MWLTGLVAPRHVGSSQTRARTRVPCIGRQTLNHCATREAHKISIFKKYICLGTSLVVQWLRIHASTAGGPGSIHGRGTKILHAMQYSKKKKKSSKKYTCSKILFSPHIPQHPYFIGEKLEVQKTCGRYQVISSLQNSDQVLFKMLPLFQKLSEVFQIHHH